MGTDYIWLELTATAHSYELPVETFKAAVSSNKYETLNSFNLFQLPCATFDIIFNLLKAVSIW
jgi:hypothetical protein